MDTALDMSAAPPSAGARSAVTTTCAGSILSGGIVDQSTVSSGRTITSTRSTFGHVISRLDRSASDSIWVLGLGGGGGSPPSPTSWKMDSGTPKTLTYSDLNSWRVCPSGQTTASVS